MKTFSTRKKWPVEIMMVGGVAQLYIKKGGEGSGYILVLRIYKTTLRNHGYLFFHLL